jgi:uncharacterized protein YcbK (DUF882 family)
MSKNQSRRQWLRHACACGAAFVLSGRSMAQSAGVIAVEEAPTAPVDERYLALTSIHTRQSVRAVYKRGGAFDAAALESFKNLLRDRRNGEVHDIDARLYDQLFDLARAAGRAPHYEVISAYRSPESNDKMSARPGSGVSKRSLHMQGRAIDVRLRDFPTDKLRDLALAARRGGVGYYERSDFVHLDTGRFRTWTG